MNQKISSLQGIFLVMSTIVPTAILTVPNHAVRFSDQDSWISIVIAVLVGLALSFILGAICRQNPGLPFLGWLRKRLGPKTGTCIGILLTYYYFTTTLIILREFVNFLGENVLTKTPSSILMVITVGVVLYGVSHGIEVIARINLIIVFASLLVFLVTAFLLAKEAHPGFLLPIGEHSLSKIVQGGILPTSWISEAAVLLLVAPFLNDPGAARKVGISGVVGAGAELALFVVAAVSILGPKIVSHLSFPTFNMIGIIQVGRFLERVDIVFISIWICMVYIKLSIFMFGAFHCFVETFRIRSVKPLLFALGLLAVLSSLYTWPKATHLNYFNTYAVAPFLLSFNVILPLVVWLCLCFTKPKPSEARN
jgi:spore germination protein KB